MLKSILWRSIQDIQTAVKRDITDSHTHQLLQISLQSYYSNQSFTSVFLDKIHVFAEKRVGLNDYKFSS